MKMNKKILLFSIVAVFMLLTISFASAINTNNTYNERKESPLFRIRTRRAITEKITNRIDNIKTNFLGERIFFLPLLQLRDKEMISARDFLKIHTDLLTWGCFTCYGFYSVCECPPLHQELNGKNIFTCTICTLSDTVCQVDCTYIITACPDICP
jgi:hypothetical protein